MPHTYMNNSQSLNEHRISRLYDTKLHLWLGTITTLLRP